MNAKRTNEICFCFDTPDVVCVFKLKVILHLPFQIMEREEEVTQYMIRYTVIWGEPKSFNALCKKS